MECYKQICGNIDKSDYNLNFIQQSSWSDFRMVYEIMGDGEKEWKNNEFMISFFESFAIILWFLES